MENTSTQTKPIIIAGADRIIQPEGICKTIIIGEGTATMKRIMHIPKRFFIGEMLVHAYGPDGGGYTASGLSGNTVSMCRARRDPDDENTIIVEETFMHYDDWQIRDRMLRGV